MKPWHCLIGVAAVSVVVGSPVSGQDSAGAQPSQVAPPAVTAPFADGVKIAYLDPDRVASLSKEGKAATAKLTELRTRKSAEVAERSKQVESLQARITQGQSMLSADALGQLQRQFERAQVDFQRFTQDAQAEVQSAGQQISRAFMQRLFPVVGQVATEKNLWAVFTPESALIWHAPALDISEEVARRLDGPPPAPKDPQPK